MATDYEPKPQRKYGKDIIGVVLVLGLLAVCAAVVGVQRVQETAARKETTANLKKLALAVNTWESILQSLPHPTGNVTPMGPSKLSWRVDLLPYFDENELYNQFHHDEEWDSPHNKELIPRMPKVYLDSRFQNSGDRSTGLTYFQIFTGEETALGRNGDPDRSLTYVSGPHGSYTILFVEAGEPVPWTKPEDLVYDPSKPLPKLGGPSGGTFLAATCDGQVVVIPEGANEQSIRAYINCAPNDMRSVRPPWK